MLSNITQMGVKYRYVKIQNSSDSINAFGGLNFVSQSFDNAKISQLIDSELGSKSAGATYNYSDSIKALWLTFFAGGDCAEDINVHLCKSLLMLPGVKAPSADTVLRDLKRHATATTLKAGKTGIEHQTNTNEVLNKLMIKQLLLLKLLSTKEKHDFDYDNQVIPTEKYDAERSYKKCNAYQPGIATIGRHIVYLENRNGNSPAVNEQASTLRKCYEALKAEGIEIKRSRMDCASYQKDVIEVVLEFSDLFYIRAQRCDAMANQIKAATSWQKVRIGTKQYEIASIQYTPFKGETAYRVVVSREPQPQGDLLTESHFSYRGIITNDEAMTDFEVLQYYNQRGGQENIFDEMNNDYGWTKMPFSFLNENTVFLIVMAMCRSFYLYFLEKYSKATTFVKNTFRLKRFRFRFINVAAKWIKKSDQHVLKLFTDKDYSKLAKT